MVDPSGIYGIEGPSEICTQSAEVWLAVSGAQPLFALGLLMFALFLVDFPSLLLSPSTDFNIFYFCKKYHLKDTYKIFKKNSCWFKIWMGFVEPILIKLWTSSFWGFLYLPEWWPLASYLCKHAGDHSVTNEACSPPHLTCLGLYGMAAWKLKWTICATEQAKRIYVESLIEKNKDIIVFDPLLFILLLSAN